MSTKWMHRDKNEKTSKITDLKFTSKMICRNVFSLTPSPKKKMPVDLSLWQLYHIKLIL